MNTFLKKISKNKKKIGLLTAVFGVGAIGLKFTGLASVLTACANFIADSSVTASIFWVMEEPKMPTSLVLKQNEK
jgi:cyclic lactone autoinducer peptide